MVAAEAAACGALPVCADALRPRRGRARARRRGAGGGAAAGSRSPSAPAPVRGDRRAARRRGSRRPTALREATRAALVETVRERWSWEGVARGVIAAAAGPLDELPAPADALAVGTGAPAAARIAVVPRDDVGLGRRGAAFAAVAAPRCGASRLPAAAATSRATAPTSSTASSCSWRECGSCHALARAGTKGTVGPNLDAAFPQSLAGRLRARHRPGRREASRSSTRRARQDAREARQGPGRRRRRRLRRATRRPSPARTPARSPTAVRGGEQKPRRGARTASSRSTPTPTASSPTRSATRPRPPGALEIDSQNDVLDAARHRASAGHRRPELGKGETVSSGGVSTVTVDLRARRLHVLLHAPRPPRGRHAGHAHRQIAPRGRRVSAGVLVAAPGGARRSRRGWAGRRRVVLARGVPEEPGAAR